MDSNTLYCRTIGDIRSVIEKPDDYEVLRASALLRQLLLDENRLVDDVNRQHRVKLRFKVADSWDTPYAKVVLEDDPTFYSVLDGLYPGTTPIKAPIKRLNRDQFLGYAVVFVKGSFYTVRDIIDHCANVLGGVHFGPARGESQETLSKLRNIRVDGSSVSGRQLLSILKVVREGLEPLTEKVC
jgi:hypothetical protein